MSKSNAVRAGLWDIRREDILLYVPVLLSIGIGGYFSLTFEPSIHVLLAIFCAFLGGWLLIPENFKSGRVIVLCILVIASGVCAAKIRATLVHAPVIKSPLSAVDVTGVIEEVDYLPDGQGYRIILRPYMIEGISLKKDLPRRIRIKAHGSAEAYYPNQVVQFRAGLNPPGPPVMPGASDFQRYSYFQRLGAVGFAYSSPEIINSNTTNNRSGAWEFLRLTISQKVRDAVQEGPVGVMTTFMTGEKTGIPEENLQAMRDSGLAHLLAISGLHVGLVAGVIFFFIRSFLALWPAIALKFPIKKYAAGCALVAAFFYMMLVGATIPTQRAMMMTGVALFAIMIDRSPFSLRMVALAAIVILIVFPESLVSVSFQMSFAAVTVLVWFYDRFRPYIQKFYKEASIFRRSALYVIGVAVTSILASLATAPFSLYHFQNWSFLGVFANILAMPVMAFFVMPLAVISYTAMPFGLEAGALNFMAFGVTWILDVAFWVSSFPYAVLHTHIYPYYVLSAFCLSFLMLILGPLALKLGGGLIMTGALVLLLLGNRLPDVLLSPDGKLVGIYTESSGLVINSNRAGRYVRSQWSDILQSHSTKTFDQSEFIQCGSDGCRYQAGEVKVSFPKTPYAQQEDCDWVDIMIITEPPSLTCEGAIVLNRYFTSRYGATSIYINDNNTFELLTDYDVRGKRPWTPY